MTAPSLPASMRAAVYRKRGELGIEERPVPEVGPRDVLLRVSHCGVCGTDLHFVLDGWGRPDSVGGHEYSGTIAAVGRDVRDWRVGEAVVGGPEPGCGVCEPCRSHRPGLCERQNPVGAGEVPGAFAEYIRVAESQLLRIPDGVSLREAALVEPLAVGLHAITLSGIAAGRRALVTGVGPIGMLTLAALHARGVEVTVSEPHEARRALAERVGATRCVTPDELPRPRLPFDIVDAPFDVAFECSGRAPAMESALCQLGKAGTLVLVGTGMQPPAFDPNRILLNELTITGSYVYDEDGCADALRLLASGALPTDLLIDPDDVPLDGLLDAMHGLAGGSIAGKVLVAPNNPEETR